MHKSGTGEGVGSGKYRPSDPKNRHRQILNSDTHVSGRTNGFGLFLPGPGAWPDSDTVSYTRFLASPQGHLLRRNRPVRYSPEEGALKRKLAGMALASVASQNP